MVVEHVEYADSNGEKEKEVFNVIKTDTDELLGFEVNEYLAKFLDISEQSKEGEKKEKQMGLKEGLKTYPKAAFWSFVLCSTLIMEGYDTNLLSSFYTFPAFNERFGKYYEEAGEYEIEAKWQTALSMAINVGEIVGLFFAGLIADRFGYRKTLMGSLVLVTGFIFIVFFAKSIEMLLVGEILLGLPWGAFQTLCVTYASDVCPMTLRLYLTTYANCCWVIGQLISSCVLRAFVSSSDKDAYRIPFAVQWVWPIPIFIGVFFAPESPWWLARKGRDAEAKESLKRLLTVNEKMPNKDEMSSALLNRIKMTLKEEDANSLNSSYVECFKGVNLRRTILTCSVWLIQNCTGAALMGFSTYFYKQAGLATSMSFTFSIIQYCLGILGTLCSWIVSQKLGRFTVYFGGLIILFVILFIVGCLGIHQTSATGWAVGTFLLIYTFVYDSTIGPICYCVITELPSVRLRNKTVVLARNVYNISGIVVSVITPYMLNPTAWNWKAKTGFFWSGFALASIIWCWFMLPETKQRTIAELDQLFAQKVKARNFKTTEVEVFNTEELLNKMGDDGVKEFVINTEKLEKEEC
ncbi:uncharacterized protein PRCAT00001388001 [Priceomyces carsonii]|uniref:uncharacterized protein n=1 Tax=Priceomyces carsonii TaxID=28549 RepID=UPI002ED9B0E1|nr:unnamed protein product [Priceomyces carsonii]